MSTNQQNKNNEEEEVDLGSLFIIIEKGFSNLFTFIGNIFKGIFHFLISILIFFKENFIKITIATVIGFIIGVFLEVRKPVKYGAELLVKPNFKSTRQLYNNIHYFNELVAQQKTETLQKVFNLDIEEAASLKKFEIEPLKIEKDIVSAYDELILEVDTLAISNYEFLEFKSTFTDFDYKVHKIIVEAEKNNVFDSLTEVIISSIKENNYFNRLKNLTNADVNRKDSLYKQDLIQLDSLRKVYMKVLLEDSKKQTSGTNIDLGNEISTNKELELYNISRRLNSDLEEITSQKSENYEVINVISNFQSLGYKITGITKNYAFLLAFLFGGSLVIFLLLRKLNVYLENYKK